MADERDLFVVIINKLFGPHSDGVVECFNQRLSEVNEKARKFRERYPDKVVEIGTIDRSKSLYFLVDFEGKKKFEVQLDESN